MNECMYIGWMCRLMDGWKVERVCLYFKQTTQDNYHNITSYHMIILIITYLGSGIFINVGRTMIINSTTILPSPVFDMLDHKSRCIKEDTSSFCNNKCLCTGT